MLMSSFGGLLRLVAMLFANNYHEYVPYRLKYRNFTHEVLADFHQNPFASTHSLDTNPFDDPPPQPSITPEELRRRELDLERRETDLNNKTEYLRRHGRNNFPPCQCNSHFLLRLLSYPHLRPSSFPLNFPFNPRRNT